MKVGSSPHTRGARQHLLFVREGVWDHPRIRGEHQEGLVGVLGAAGSSPHTRGAPRHLHLRRQKGGIIPAYAGSTWRRTGRRPQTRDHPRIRGEHLDLAERLPLADGSSPHTRGARTTHRQETERHGIIPAYAGSTDWASRRVAWAGDHPRIRGEHSGGALVGDGGVGSSPHTRGAPTAMA